MMQLLKVAACGRAFRCTQDLRQLSGSGTEGLAVLPATSLSQAAVPSALNEPLPL